MTFWYFCKKKYVEVPQQCLIGTKKEDYIKIFCIDDRMAVIQRRTGNTMTKRKRTKYYTENYRLSDTTLLKNLRKCSSLNLKWHVP
jgi:hypothetical protein